MWFLVATMLVMGHHVQIYVEKHASQEDCEARITYVKDRIEQRNIVINMVCETDA